MRSGGDARSPQHLAFTACLGGGVDLTEQPSFQALKAGLNYKF